MRDLTVSFLLEKSIPKSNEVMNALDLCNRFTLVTAADQFSAEVSAFTRKYEKFLTRLPLSTNQTTSTDFHLQSFYNSVLKYFS